MFELQGDNKQAKLLYEQLLQGTSVPDQIRANAYRQLGKSLWYIFIHVNMHSIRSTDIHSYITCTYIYACIHMNENIHTCQHTYHPHANINTNILTTHSILNM